MKSNQPLTVLISPDLPPKRGGVADHSHRLLQELAALGPVGVVTSPGNEHPSGIELTRTVADWRNASLMWSILEGLPERSVLIWQYVPHMYGRGGVNSAIPNVIARWRREGRRQLVLVHELYAPWSLLPNRWWYARQQRRQWSVIRRSVDGLGMSTEAWLNAEVGRVGGAAADRYFLCPSPSNIPQAAVSADHARQWRARQGWAEQAQVIAVFGSFGPPSRWKWIEKASRMLRVSEPEARWVTLGQGSLGLARSGSDWFHPLGFVDARAVSEALQAATLLAVPYVDGVSERRTSAMAGLAHGCCVAATCGESTGPSLRSGGFMGLSSSEDAAAYARLVGGLLRDSGLRGDLGRRARAAYADAYDWPVVVGRIQERLNRMAVEAP